ncbi:MAG: hypothetical protein AB2697_14630 [Candidatus Thiodiazotropha endolucinida]
MNNEIKRVINIWWVDDDFLDSSRDNYRVLRLYEKDNRLAIVGYPPLEFEKVLENTKKAPELFLIDYKLNEIENSEGKKYAYTGTGLVGRIRDKFPEHPIYMVSRILEKRHLIEDVDLFDRLLMHESLTAREKTAKEILINDALDYQKIRRIRNRHSIKPILNLLSIPKGETKDFEELLPEQLKGGIGDPTVHSSTGNIEFTYQLSGAIRFARWTKRNLLLRPGPLYDDLYAATFLGMTEKYFVKSFIDKYTSFDNKATALYSGIFSNSSDKRLWWKGELTKYVLSQDESNEFPVTDIWRYAPRVLPRIYGHIKKGR